MPIFRTVIFDCDSTLSAIEGIDELAVNCRDEVARLTDAAMRGEIPLEQVYGRRLALVRPTRAAVEALAREYVVRLVPDARETVAALLAAAVDVRIVSGGLRPAVLAVARELGVPESHVAAVDVAFDAHDDYAGYDATSPVAFTGGKRVAIERWSFPRPAMMVGDGTTDLEARPAVDAFVAFAGVVAREAVVRAADAVITTPSLAPLLPLVLHDSDLVASAHRQTFARGVALARTPPDPVA